MIYEHDGATFRYGTLASDLILKDQVNVQGHHTQGS